MMAKPLSKRWGETAGLCHSTLAYRAGAVSGGRNHAAILDDKSEIGLERLKGKFCERGRPTYNCMAALRSNCRW